MDQFSHMNEKGEVHMVDVSEKSVTNRRAVASALVTVGAEVLERLQAQALPKGDAITTARIAGIQAAKRTAELIPLCHGISSEHVDVRIDVAPPDALRVIAETRAIGRTGVEMEALVAASVAALTIYDMCKAVRRDIVIGPVQLEHKSGGKSDWTRDANSLRASQ
ncbi:MAG: cyclic pyranopterin monophosphate synthase MoaC [Phycisphaerales bacterium]|nr:cyclic pyranopterin monophosphate synthase MoaC [Phycisphaerales bacterium]